LRNLTLRYNSILGQILGRSTGLAHGDVLRYSRGNRMVGGRPAQYAMGRSAVGYATSTSD